MILAAVIASLALSFGTASAAEYRTGQPVMGTILQVTVIASDAAKARDAAAAAIAEVQRWDDVLTIWREDGELARLNRNAGNGRVAISPELHRALEQMMTLSAQTGGAFDPGVGPLVKLWSAGAIPARDAIERVGPVQILSALRLDSNGATLAAGAAIDSGAIGKSIGLDAAVEVLRKAGVEAAFLDFGGSSQTALGAPPDSPEGWPIAIAGLASGTLRGVIALRDASLSTSRARGPEATDGRIVDPRSGQAIADPRLATVRARTAATANAWSTALVVLGRTALQDADEKDLDAFIEDRDGVSQTPGFIRVPK